MPGMCEHSVPSDGNGQGPLGSFGLSTPVSPGTKGAATGLVMQGSEGQVRGDLEYLLALGTLPSSPHFLPHSQASCVLTAAVVLQRQQAGGQTC